MIYRAFKLNFWGHVLDVQELDCDSNEEAVSRAAELFGDDAVEIAVEVWLGPRRIARLQDVKADASPRAARGES